jgi:hypothetical protein
VPVVHATTDTLAGPHIIIESKKKQREIFPFETNKLTVTREAQRGEGDRCFESIIGRETDDYSGPSGLCRAGEKNCYSTTLQIFTIL